MEVSRRRTCCQFTTEMFYYVNSFPTFIQYILSLSSTIVFVSITITSHQRKRANQCIGKPLLFTCRISSILKTDKICITINKSIFMKFSKRCKSIFMKFSRRCKPLLLMYRQEYVWFLKYIDIDIDTVPPPSQFRKLIFHVVFLHIIREEN